jgi:hypothetical protein
MAGSQLQAAGQQQAPASCRRAGLLAACSRQQRSCWLGCMSYFRCWILQRRAIEREPGAAGALHLAAPMDEQQRYLFDTRGVFTIPGTLSAGEVAELNRIFDEVEASDLPEHGGTAGVMGGDALHVSGANMSTASILRV